MKMKRVLAAMAFFCLSAGLAADIVRNGSFETFGGNGVPAEWNFRLNKNNIQHKIPPSLCNCSFCVYKFRTALIVCQSAAKINPKTFFFFGFYSIHIKKNRTGRNL